MSSVTFPLATKTLFSQVQGLLAAHTGLHNRSASILFVSYFYKRRSFPFEDWRFFEPLVAAFEGCLLLSLSNLPLYWEEVVNFARHFLPLNYYGNNFCNVTHPCLVTLLLNSCSHIPGITYKSTFLHVILLIETLVNNSLLSNKPRPPPLPQLSYTICTISSNVCCSYHFYVWYLFFKEEDLWLQYLYI